MDEKEQQIIQEIRSGNKQVYKHLFELYYPALSAFAFKYLKDIDSSREIVQDLFVNIYEKRESIEVKDSLKAYLFRSTRNKCLNALRQKKTKREYHELITRNMESVADLNDQIMQVELENEIFRVVESLPPKCKDIFIMSRVSGRTNSQIADELEISIRTVETQISKTLREIRKQLGNYLNSE